MHTRGKKKGPPGRKASSQTSNGRASSEPGGSAAAKDRLDDPYPQRLTNPLVEFSTKSIQDILRITEGVQFAQPDTFSLHYYSRLLGVPLQNEETPDKLIIQHPPVPKDAVYDVPKLGVYNPNALFWTPNDSDATLLQETPQQFDPFYLCLYNNDPSSVRVAATATEHARFLNYKILTDVRAACPDQASQWDSYTFLSMAQYKQEHPQHHRQHHVSHDHGWVALQHNNNNKVVGSIAIQLEWYRNRDESPQESLLLGHILHLSADDAWLRTALVCLVVSQLRHCQVWYALYRNNITGFRMTPQQKSTVQGGGDYWLMDVLKCSPKLAFLTYQQATSSSQRLSNEGRGSTERFLVHMPTCEEVHECLTEDGVSVAKKASPLERRSNVVSKIYIGDTQLKTLQLQFHTDTREIARKVPPKQQGEEEIEVSCTPLPTFHSEPPSIGILRNFTLPTEASGVRHYGPDPLLDELIAKQKELEDIEKGLQPKLRSLMETIIDKRVKYESQETLDRKAEERRVLLESRKMLDAHKELDLAHQNKLLQDMDAVCCICTDGEVTPENQILFCESCNVAVHQMCYGIDRVPEGDYYCWACRRLGKDQVQARVPPHLRVPLKLGICCELCPLRNGAFVRTDVPAEPGEPDKFVHVVCRKWMGLSHVDPGTVEDVTETKIDFRRHRIKCDLCLGERGGMIKCKSDERCNKWFHVTCARAIGNMKIIHGENCHGDVEEDGWSLWCAEHSDVPARSKPPTKHTLSRETLIELAKDFPPDPRPPLEHRPFNCLDGPDRSELLADPEYEQPLIKELLNKRMYGARCEVCNSADEDTKNLTRCSGCSLVFCISCKFPNDDVSKGSYRCPQCQFVDAKKKAGEEFETPQCLCCYQKGGFLGVAYARPMKKTYWKSRVEEYKRSVFGRRLWVHALCAYWHPLITVDRHGKIDLSQVVLSDGRGQMINREQLCFLCGQTGGIKMKCDQAGCCEYGVAAEGDGQPLVMHATCARQAGLEVRLDDSDDEVYFYVRCYRHGGNEFNLRAQLEDLIEIEKKRAGKDHAKADAPMKFSDGSRVLLSAIQVMRTLGWAWRWAEWWVDYDSSWEPLLEPGQKEKNMTKEELKIVDSTRESRCEDARRCRLSAFGAALRTRAYDTEDGFNNEALERALRAVLSTKSLVGPLLEVEEDFFVDWLARAYRSKSRLLGYGEQSSAISLTAPYTVHSKDKSPKFELGSRPLPGAQELARGRLFENVTEVDDFLLFPVVLDKVRARPGRHKKRSSSKRRSGEDYDSDDSLDTPTWKTKGWNKPGRRKSKLLRASDSDSHPVRKRLVAPLGLFKKRSGRPPTNGPKSKRRKLAPGLKRRIVQSKVDLRSIGGPRSTVIEIFASSFADNDASSNDSDSEVADTHIENKSEKESDVEESKQDAIMEDDKDVDFETPDSVANPEEVNEAETEKKKKEEASEPSLPRNDSAHKEDDTAPPTSELGAAKDEDSFDTDDKRQLSARRSPRRRSRTKKVNDDDEDIPIQVLVASMKPRSPSVSNKPKKTTKASTGSLKEEKSSSYEEKPDTPQKRGRERGKLMAADRIFF